MLSSKIDALLTKKFNFKISLLNLNREHRTKAKVKNLHPYKILFKKIKKYV